MEETNSPTHHGASAPDLYAFGGLGHEGLTRSDTQTIQKRLAELAEGIFAEYGLTLDKCNATYDAQNVSISIGATNRSAPLKASDLQVLGIPTDTKRGAEFQYGDKRYALQGFKWSRTKYPITATNLENGKEYKLPRESVRELWEAAKR